MVFFLWGHTKALIYTLPFDSEEVLVAHIVEAAAAWHFEHTHQSLLHCS
jgi:hypothetical protein